MMKTYKEFFVFLIESRIDSIKDKFKDINADHDEYAEHKKSSDIVNHFAEKADPSFNKEHTQWILNQYKKGNIRQEDAPRIHNTLKNFGKHKSKLENKDINSYKHISDLESALEPHINSKSKREEVKDIKHEGAEKIHDENGVQVHHLKSKEAACQYGAGTKWCTAAKNDNMFDHYNKKGKIYHVKARDENGKMAKYQFHHESKQYMDSADKNVDLHKLAERNPELRNVKEFQGKHPALTKDYDKHFSDLLKNNLKETLNDPRVNSKHLHKALSDKDEYVRAAAAGHPNANADHLDKALRDENVHVRRQAAGHPNANADHLDKALRDKYYVVRSAAAGNPNANADHLHKALGDKYYDVRMAAAVHPNANADHLDKALRDKDVDVREAAAGNPNANADHLDKALGDEDANVRRKAANQMNKRNIKNK